MQTNHYTLIVSLWSWQYGFDHHKRRGLSGGYTMLAISTRLHKTVIILRMERDTLNLTGNDSRKLAPPLPKLNPDIRDLNFHFPPPGLCRYDIASQGHKHMNYLWFQ
ncbi:hypothetical protein [Salinisphaera sp. G21_0]|uniref:hypothetical protein n=1 Tax=Salinisphaera sp. G21_0 TaxID=2821094 RepID=UPI001AD9DA83|nr:hypothetical protein [Salinisphaera sp. G21_0]MBO9481424.1 hypothetical protein [Salinisphaera sp. G21_0]